jgi:nucleotide-binding universal stress UspA family protein
MAIRLLLVGTDFSACARAALDLAVEIAAPVAGTILLVHAYELPVYPLPDGTILGLDVDAIARIERSVDEELEAERHRVSARGVPITAVRCDGNPQEVLLHEARSRGADLILVGTHGRSGLRRVLLGSIAEGVLRAAPCPVVVVREVER